MDRLSADSTNRWKQLNIFSESNKSAVLCLLSARSRSVESPRFSHSDGLRKKFPPFKRGAQNVLPCLKVGGGVQKVSGPQFSHSVDPPLPVINDQSLR